MEPSGPRAFSSAEQAKIIDLWRMVAEDFAPFHIDVTTQNPGLEALRAITTAGAEVRTVLLCSAISAKQILEALQLGARGVVLKKRVAELLEALDAVMNRKVKGKVVLVMD